MQLDQHQQHQTLHPRYRLVLDFLDPSTDLLPHELAHPLLPKTRTLLPPSQDTELRAALPRLTLPISFWQPLPRSKALNTVEQLSATPSAPVPPPPPTRASSIWSESSEAYSPSIATADLFTPSQAVQAPTLDFRFGPLELDWVDSPDPDLHSPLLPPSSPTMSPPSQLLPLHTAAPGPSSQRPSKAARTPEKAGSTALYWGTIHLYRELGADEKSSSDKDKQAAVAADDGTVVGMISVPGNITAASLLAFVSPALESIAQVRMLRDSTPNRSMVLLRFRDAADAAEFKVMYNGKPYHDTKESEVCHVVSISAIKLKASTTPPFTFPYSPDLETKPLEEAVELPTCPVCLERMDQKASGLITVMCQHSFHCSCLLKWGDSRCPVCRSTNYRTRKATLSSPTTSRCTICQSPSNLWICLICGNVGCGRYQGGHAHSHFSESGHSYSMELETQRVWDYVTDSYVHRLIRNRADGKLVELPSLSSTKSPSDEGNGKGNGTGPDKDTEESQDKLEAMGIEYSNLMTSQLDSQRAYYEEEVARIKEELEVTKAKWDEAAGEAARGRRERTELDKKVEALEEALRKEREDEKARRDAQSKAAAEDDARRKKDRAEALKARKDLERQLEAERAVSASLASNLSHLRLEVQQHEEQSQALRLEMDDLRDQMRDVMFALSARDQIEAEGGAASEAAGGTVSVPVPPPALAARRKKKR